MTCREFNAFIVEYLDDALPVDGRARFEQHLGRCPNCDEYLRQYRLTITLCQTAFAHPDAPVPGEVPEELVRAILAARKIL